MMNKAFWRSIHSLTHPISILAVLLLLFNDHYLRHVSPSWMTGKLGDFTWLLFVPFVAGLLFAIVIPRRVQNHERIVGLASIGFIGVWFATAKTIPLVHHITTSAFEWLVGWQGQLRLDVTDLLTLPALLISWYIWRTVPNVQINLKPYAPIIFSLAILGTLANFDTPDSGITCLDQEDGIIFASTHSHEYGIASFKSEDGGMNWEQVTFPRDSSFIQACNRNSYRQVIIDTWELLDEESNVLYRFHPNSRIEVFDSEELIATYSISQYQLDVQSSYYGIGDEFYEYMYGPVDAQVDSNTGNLIMAMSLNGVLVITPDGNPIWADLGDYGYIELSDSDAIQLLIPEFILAGFLASLVSLLLLVRKNCYLNFMSIVLWIIWILSVFVFRGFVEYLNNGFVTLFCSGIVIIIAIFVVSYVVIHFVRLRTALMSVSLMSLIVAALFMFPFILWVEARIPNYITALVLALFLTASGTITAHRRIRKIYFIEPDPSSPQVVHEPWTGRKSRFAPDKAHDIDSTINPFESE